MPDYIRVKQRDTRHELSIVASAFDETAYERLDKPATKRDGTPLPPKYHMPLSGVAGRKSAPKAKQAGSEKEKSE
ncbi:MAG TPA: hypothetical protein VFL94_02105 [Actinomycetales bacterium]|nr:hypothetical protein [Actinomycetales bacterium]